MFGWILRLVPWISTGLKFLSAKKLAVGVIILVILMVIAFVGGYKLKSMNCRSQLTEIQTAHTKAVDKALVEAIERLRVRQQLSQDLQRDLVGKINELSETNRSLEEEIDNAELVEIEVVRVPCVDGQSEVPVVDFDAFGRLFNSTGVRPASSAGQD